MTMQNYQSFLASKRLTVKPSGFDVAPDALSPHLFDYQRAVVKWAIRKGKAALFLDTGLGKTPCLLEWGKQVHAHAGVNVLILAPLAVSKQIAREGEKFGIPVKVCREQADCTPGLNVTNYERLHKFEPSAFGAIIMDEASILKSRDGKTRTAILEAFAATPYKLLATATPSPNDQMELGTYAEFLGIMSYVEMLATFFCHDGGDTSVWRLKGHAEADFYAWLASWSVAMRSPADLGYDASRHNLPKLHRHEIVVAADDETAARQGTLFAVEAQTLLERRQARKDSLPERVQIAADLINAMPADEKVIVWCLPPVAPVVMGDGTEMPIGDINPGDVVMSGSGIPRRVERVLRRHHNGSMVRIKVRGVCDVIEITPEHKIPTDKGWIQAGELTSGVFLKEPKLSMSSRDGSYKAGWIVGMYAAQGWRVRGERGTNNLVGFTVHREKSSDIIAVLTDFCGKEPRIRTMPDNLAIHVESSHVALRNLVDEWVIGNEAKVKKLSQMPCDSQFANGVLKGWIEGDGSRQGIADIGQTSSRNLARQMHMLSVALGHSTTMTTGINRPGPQARQNGQSFPCNPWWRVGVSHYSGHYSQPKDRGSEVWREITSVELFHYEGEVVDLTVEVDHTFLTNGIAVSNCNLNAEGDALTKAISGAQQVAGSDDPEVKEDRLMTFAHGDLHRLVTKPSIAGHGLNLQECHIQFFVGLSDSFEELYQAERRTWRFGQTEEVHTHIITSEIEGAVVRNTARKEAQHHAMMDGLVSHMRAAMAAELGSSGRSEEEYKAGKVMRLPSWLRSEAA